MTPPWAGSSRSPTTRPELEEKVVGPAGNPLTHGSIFVVFNLHQELDPVEAFSELRRQAVRAVELGFDGVALSEHHAGFPGYLPNPLQAAGLLLSHLSRGWVGAIPMILPLRSTGGVVEEAAWLDAAYPGRVVVGFAAGYVETDFTAFGVPFETRFPLFRKMFEEVAHGLRGESSIEMLRRDPAVAAAAGRVGLAMSTSGMHNARLAARLDAALVPTQLSEEGYRELFRVYRAAGGDGARVVQKWVYLGDPPTSSMEALNEGYRDVPGDHSWWTSSSRIVPMDDRDPARMADRILAWVRASDASALAIRFQIGPLPAEDVRGQIERFGSEVLPILRNGMREVAAAEKGAAG
jgi:alkanesulfonate monooxygenase SsuD/methylene tetrahydromethanopterin reductase-like flavin-dependent oxidoreductase (luciferase family)